MHATFYLRHRLGDRVDLTPVAEQDHFLFEPSTIDIPFGEDPERLLRGPAGRAAMR